MKRGGPLRRSTALRATQRLSTPTRRRDARNGDERLSPQRIRAAERDVLWRSIRRFVLERDGGCRGRHVAPGPCSYGPLEVHHLRRRSQGWSSDPADYVALCGAHHRWVTEHPSAAHAVGLVRWGWE